MTTTTRAINQLITDLDSGRANGAIYTYGQVQERLRAIVAAEADAAVERDSSDTCGAPANGGPCILPRGHNMGRLDVPSNHHREAAADPEIAFLDWLIDIAYPFDTVFDPPPPVNLKRLALRWKERDDWSDVSDEDAIACIEEEANCG